MREMALGNSSYKQYHESYMSHHKGSTIWESLCMIIPYPVLIYFVSYTVNLISPSRHFLSCFLTEFILSIVPVVLVYTVFNEFNFIFLLFVVLFYITFIVHECMKNLRILKILLSLDSPQKRSFITYYRSISNILAAFCILAVDFKIFPRRFAKTETYGYGLMDTGVGFFLISNGLVTKPRLQDHLMKSLKSSIPLIILGLIRCFSINALDYQQHVSEYGVYWNFFFTLAAVKLMCPLILAQWPNGALLTSITLALMHQAALSTGIEDWIINDDSREGILASNKEGFISLPGYLSLYLAAVYIGKLLTSDRIQMREDISRVIKLWSLSIIFFTLTYVFQHEFNVSRRLLNLTYITWLLSFSLFLLGLCIVIEISLKILNFFQGQNKTNENPIILEAVNYNSLLFFLFANILTGVINLSMKTLLITPLMSVLILVAYMFVLTFVICVLYKYKIQIKIK